MASNTLSRSLHDLGLSAWFGGTLANAVSLNAAAAEAGRDGDSGAVANKGWDRWTPVNAAAIGVHLLGSVGQLAGNKGRVAGQDGVASMALLKTGLTVTALGVTAYSRALGKTVSSHGPVPVSSGTEPTSETPAEVAAAQKKLALLQWVVPALTGALTVVSSYAGEQQRATSQLQGLQRRILG